MKRLALFLTLLLLPASAAAQDPCAHNDFGLGFGPARVGLEAGDLGAGWRACGRKELGLSAGGALTVDLANFYGRLSAPVALDGSWMVTDRLEVFAQIEFLRAEMLITPLSSSAIGFGHTTFGLSYGFLRSRKLGLAAHARAVLPTAVPLYRNALPFGFDVGLAGQLEINRHIHFHGDANVMFQAMAGKGPAAPRGGGTVLLGAQFVIVPEVGVVVESRARFGWGDEPLELAAGVLGLRLSDCKRFGFEVDALIPIVGRDRTTVALELRASVKWGPIGRPLWHPAKKKGPDKG